MGKRSARAVGLCVSLLLGTAVAGATHGCNRVPEAPTLTPPSAEDRALIAPLVEGSSVGAYRITHVGRTAGGTLCLELTDGTKPAKIEIARYDRSAPHAPLDLAAYSVYFTNTPEKEGAALVADVGAIVKVNARMPVPEWMKSYVAGPRP